MVVKNIRVVAAVIFTWGALCSVSCTKNIEPLPDKVSVSPSVALPVGIGYFNLSKTLHLVGVPSINLTESVPEWATYRYVYVEEEFPFNIHEAYNEAEIIDRIEFKLNLWNEFPLAANAQVYVLNGSDAVIDSLLTEPLLVPRAEHYSDGSVIGTRFESTRVLLDDARIDKLQEGRKVRVKAGLIVTEEGINSQNINLFDQYTMTVQIAAKIDFSVSN